jgi:hypothetical protein
MLGVHDNRELTHLLYSTIEIYRIMPNLDLYVSTISFIDVCSYL